MEGACLASCTQSQGAGSWLILPNHSLPLSHQMSGLKVMSSLSLGAGNGLHRKGSEPAINSLCEPSKSLPLLASVYQC